MSSPIRKKIRKKKKKKQDTNNEIVPQRHEREGNLNYYSEEIAKNMIEKIISLAISTNFTQNVEKKFDQFCINLITRKIDNLVEMVHINRDKDDFDIDNIDIQSYIKYNKSDANIQRYKSIIHKNAWEIRNDNAEDNLLDIANIPKDIKTYMNVNNKKIEDCLNNSNTITKNKHLKKDKFYQYNIDITKKNYWGDIPQPLNINIDRTTSNFNSYIPRKEDKNKNSTSNSKNKNKEQTAKLSDKKKSFFKYYKHFSSRVNKNLIESSKERKNSNYDDENANKKRRITMVNLPSFPIENLEIRKESQEILNLRKETLELIQQREKELQELKQRKIKIRNDLDKDKKKKKGKYTYDNEGKLILVNEIKPENFLKEFWPVMSKQKEIKSGKTLEAVKKEKIKMENNAKKNIEYNEEDRPYKLYLIKSRINDYSMNDINKDNDKEKENTNDNNKNSNQKEIKRKNNSVVFNENNIRFEPSGSNFQIMNPSIGVKIQEKLRVKNGGINFYEKFHKYSINEFNKTLQDTIEWSKYKIKEKQNEGFISTNPLPHLSKMNSIKEEKEMSGVKTAESKSNKKSKKKNYFQKTFTNGFHKSKILVQSKSEIYSPNEQFPKLKEILLHDDQNEKKIMIKLQKDKNRKFENILGNRKQSSINRNNSMIEERKLKKKYLDIDNFNKNLIMGMAVPERSNNRKMILPKISWRNLNELNFNNTMTQFHRTRIKKGNPDDSSLKINEKNKSKNKGMKRVNSVKVI